MVDATLIVGVTHKLKPQAGDGDTELSFDLLFIEMHIKKDSDPGPGLTLHLNILSFENGKN